MALLAFLLVVTGLCCEAEIPAAPTVAGAAVDERYDTQFLPQKRGFLGADGAASILLPDGRLLWIFGDTVIGTQLAGKREGPMIHNSIAIQDLTIPGAAGISYWWDLPERIPAEPFRPQEAGNPNWFWPGCGVTVGSRAYLFLTEIGKGAGSDGFAFSTKGCTLIRLENPTESPEKWKMTQVRLVEANDHFNINSAAFVEGDQVYLLGYHDGPTSKPTDRAAFLCRLPVAALDTASPGTAIEYWTRDKTWGKTPASLQPLFKPGPTETAISYDPVRKRYFAATINPFQKELMLVSAESLTGPWTEPQPVYSIPQVDEAKKLHAYTTRIHPWLAKGPDELVISYVVNSSDFWSMFSQMDIYYPRFVRVRLAAPGGETAGSGK